MIEILVIVEAEADCRTATGLADRVMKEKCPDWIADNLCSYRRWVGFESSELTEDSDPAKDPIEFTCWKALKEFRKNKYPRIRSLGHLRGEPLHYDGMQARLVVLMAERERRTRPNLKAILFIRDLDTHADKEGRIKSLQQVRDAFPDDFVIVIGVSDTKREAWVLNGFIPEDDIERRLLETIQQELGFDPCLDAHRLRTVSHTNQKEQVRNAKVVLRKLIPGDSNRGKGKLPSEDFRREERCWMETNLDLLRERGEKTYLTAYLKEIEERLVPLLSG